MPSLKEDASFVEFLALGATATEKTQSYLNGLGHDVIELERGALSSRRWEYKEKRLRVPDLMCANCGRRIESRGKKALEIKMSHSTSDSEREWDADARNSDLIAFVRCYKIGELPTDWEAPEAVNIIDYSSLRDVEEKTKQERSGPTQGSELTIEWPSIVPSADGTVKQIDKESGRLQVSRASDGYTLSYSLSRSIGDRGEAEVEPFVEKGDSVRGEEEIIAAPASLKSDDETQCDDSYSAEDYLDDIESGNFGERFAAVKALGFIEVPDDVFDTLTTVLENEDNNYFLRLEAAGSLARHGRDEGYDFLVDSARQIDLDDPETNATRRLEAILILGEVGGERAGSTLTDALSDEDELGELRAQAAYTLGEIGDPEFATALVDAFEYDDEQIRDDAIYGLSKLGEAGVDAALNGLNADSEDKQIGAAIALAQMDSVSIAEILENAEEGSVSEKWLSFAFGLRDAEEITANTESIEELSEDVEFGTEVVSSIFNSWADPLSERIRFELRREPENEDGNGQSNIDEF